VTPHPALFPMALARLPDADGQMRATLRLAMLTGWAPSPDQPQPLKPGSAQISLGEALQDRPGS
jgi:hypothetical protein